MDLPVLDIGSYEESDYTVTEDMVIKGMHPGALSIKTNGNHEITLNNVTGVIYLDFSSSMNIKLKGENRLNYIRSIGVELCDFTIDDAGDDGGTLIVIDDGTPLAGNFIINGGTVKAKDTNMGHAVNGSLTINGGAVYLAGGGGNRAVSGEIGGKATWFGWNDVLWMQLWYHSQYITTDNSSAPPTDPYTTDWNW